MSKGKLMDREKFEKESHIDRKANRKKYLYKF